MKLCIIGAGLSGLVTLKELKEEGHEIICYEQGSETGGVFRPQDGSNPAYDDCLLTVSNHFMAFSSLPPEEPERRFWTRGEYHQYLQRFAATFQLLPHIQFNTKVEEIMRREDGSWLVRIKGNGAEHNAIFDGVAVCSGQFRNPRIPAINGLDRFQGEVLHTVDYRNAEPFQGQRVVCIGSGESSADVCHQVAQVAATATLIMRRPPPILPRNWKHWLGIDDTVDANSCRMADKVFSESRFMAEEAFKRIDPFHPPKHDETEFISEWHWMTNHVFGQFGVKNDIFIRDILDEILDYNLFGVKEVGPDYVLCGDGERIAADVIILNTGYQNDFSLFTNLPEIQTAAQDIRQLYKHMIHPQVGQTLAFIGFVRPDPGGLPACAEMQARYWAQLCSGNVTLPEPEKLTQLTAEEAQIEAASYYAKPNLSELIRYRAFNDGLAALIGCQPKRPLFNPNMLMRYYFGSSVSNWYRLRGPGSNPEEAKAVIKRLPISFPPLVRVGLLFTVSMMNLAVFADKLTFGRLTRKFAQRPELAAFLQKELKVTQLDPGVTLHSLCADRHAWHHLKYKLHQLYEFAPQTIDTELTVAQLLTRCQEEPPQRDLLTIRGGFQPIAG